MDITFEPIKDLTMRYLWLLAIVCTQTAYAQGTKKISLEDIWQKGTFSAKSVPGFNTMQDGKHYTQLDRDGDAQVVNVYELADGSKTASLFSSADAMVDGKALKIDEYILSRDEKKMLLLTDNQNIYRRSILHNAYVYDMASKKIQKVDNDKLLHVTFSPDGNKVAYVKENNLYCKDLRSGKTQKLTTDGVKNKIINGNCDWVYEEEFGFSRAYEWSGDGRYIAYYRFDESKVKEYTMAYYDSLYPKQYTYKYPKAGEDNSLVQIKVCELASKRTVNVDLGPVKDQYIPRIKWMNDPAELCVYRMNRRQNKLELLEANARSGHSSVIYNEENKYYIDITDNMQFLPGNSSFIFSSERTGYNHLFLWDWSKHKLTELTPGAYDIESICGIDNEKKLVYYTSAERSPLQRQLYSVDWNGENKKCLTPEKGTHSITACKGNRYFLDKYSKLATPPVYYLRDAEGNIVRTLEDNKKLRDVMEDYNLGKIHFTEVNGVSEKLNAWMITPPNFNEDKQYPVLMFQYSGPGSQQVADRFPMGDYFWHQMLAQKGYIVICVDGTGTGYRGEEFRKKTYLQLGKMESDDQIAAAVNIGNLPYVDKDRIGIWGWSYGGFMSSTCIFKGADVFKAAIAVAPVTNWRYYDNIYTERYMRKPQENAAGYDDNSPEMMAGKLKGKLLLVHGTADDNVHFQNSMMLLNALIKADKEYDSEFYPNKAHGISGGNTRLHLYRRMTAFILKNL